MLCIFSSVAMQFLVSRCTGGGFTVKFQIKYYSSNKQVGSPPPATSRAEIVEKLLPKLQ